MIYKNEKTRAFASQSIPPGAWDCHMHFYREEDIGTISPIGLLMPPATLDHYRKVRDRMGTTNVVAVQSVAYGFDNSLMLDAMAKFDGLTRGVVVLPADASKSLIAEFNSQGVCGARAFMLDGSILNWSDLPFIAKQIEPFGWHLQIQLDGRTLPERFDLLNNLPCPVVIEHNGKYLTPVEPEHPSFSALLRLLDNDRTWVKLSGAYETSRTGPPHYVDVSKLAQRIVGHRPDRLVWGSNFPHPGFSNPAPDEVALLDLLLDWTGGDIELRKQILVDNPLNLYCGEA